MNVEASSQALLITYGTFYKRRYLIHFPAESNMYEEKYYVNLCPNTLTIHTYPYKVETSATLQAEVLLLPFPDQSACDIGHVPVFSLPLSFAVQIFVPCVSSEQVMQ